MQSKEDAEACITALNGTVIDGKTITVAHVSRKLDWYLTDIRLDEAEHELLLLVDTMVSRSRLAVLEVEDTVVVTVEVSCPFFDCLAHTRPTLPTPIVRLAIL